MVNVSPKAAFTWCKLLGGALAFSISPQLKCSQSFVQGAINKFGLQMMALQRRAEPRAPQQQRNKDSRRWRRAIPLQPPPPPCEDIPLCGIGPLALLEFRMDRLKSYINFIAFTVRVGFGRKAGWMDQRGASFSLFFLFLPRWAKSIQWNIVSRRMAFRSNFEPLLPFLLAKYAGVAQRFRCLHADHQGNDRRHGLNCFPCY